MLEFEFIGKDLEIIRRNHPNLGDFITLNQNNPIVIATIRHPKTTSNFAHKNLGLKFFRFFHGASLVYGPGFYIESS